MLCNIATRPGVILAPQNQAESVLCSRFQYPALPQLQVLAWNLVVDVVVLSLCCCFVLCHYLHIYALWNRTLLVLFQSDMCPFCCTNWLVGNSLNCASVWHFFHALIFGKNILCLPLPADIWVWGFKSIYIHIYWGMCCTVHKPYSRCLRINHYINCIFYDNNDIDFTCLTALKSVFPCVVKYSLSMEICCVCPWVWSSIADILRSVYGKQ